MVATNKQTGNSRRDFIAVATGLGLGVGGAALYDALFPSHKERKINQEPEIHNGREIEALKELAIKSQEGLSAREFSPSHTIGEYIDYWTLKASLPRDNFLSPSNQPSFKYFLAKQMLRLGKLYPNDYLAIADIGGMSGTAMAELQEAGDRAGGALQTFVIDPSPRIPPKGMGLSANRFIARKIENTGLADNTFHIMVSQNTMQRTDFGVAIREIWRLLKPGCIAIFENEVAMNQEEVDMLKNLPNQIKQDIEVWITIGSKHLPEGGIKNERRCLSVEKYLKLFEKTKGPELIKQFRIALTANAPGFWIKKSISF